MVTQMQQEEQHSVPLPPSNYSEDDELRLIEMCANHRLFQFMFDSDGVLLIANKRGMLTLKKHLGAQRLRGLCCPLQLLFCAWLFRAFHRE